MISRDDLCRRSGWTLLKTSKIDHDRRADAINRRATSRTLRGRGGLPGTSADAVHDRSAVLGCRSGGHRDRRGRLLLFQADAMPEGRTHPAGMGSRAARRWITP